MNAQVGSEARQGVEKPQKILHEDVRKQHKLDIALLIGVVRILSFLFTWTNFHADEYYQALEPGWQIAFGKESRAWITWEWDHQVRSSIHPILMAAIYQATHAVNFIFGFPLSLRARMFTWSPYQLHVLAASIQDFFTWRLAENLFGERSSESVVVLTANLLSPWLFFACSRTYSNGLESSCTAVALSYWPWRWYDKTATPGQRKQSAKSLPLSIIMAAYAVVLRPTNGLIWLVLTVSLFFHASQDELISLIMRISTFGLIPVITASIIDRLYYGIWTLPALKFIGFNYVENISEFYGSHRIDYYFTEGLPLLLTTLLPFALYGSYQSILGRTQGLLTGSLNNKNRADPREATAVQSTWNNTGALQALASTPIVTVAAFSCIAHKEVRFLYPLFSIFAVLSAQPLCRFFNLGSSPVSLRSNKSRLGAIIVMVNIALATYVCTFHQRGVVDVMIYIRRQFYALNTDALILGTRLTGPTSLFGAIAKLRGDSSVQHLGSLYPISVAFLMPCHSTPWRSYLVHPEIQAWTLTCEPPIGLNASAREQYLDEADVFYADPVKWLKENMGPVPTKSMPWTDQGWDMRDAPSNSSQAPTSNVFAGKGKRPWPRYVGFFEQLEDVMKKVAGGPESRYEACWRGFNSHWHDDWRRKGDVIVWCIDGSLDEDKIIEEYEERHEREEL